MDIINFSKLFTRSGGYSLPVLIELKDNNPEYPKITWYFTSNNVDVERNNKIYKSVPMAFKFPSSQNGIPQGGVLEIDLDQQYNNEELLKWFDELDDRATLEVVALINEQGVMQELSYLTQSHGSVTWNGEKISWNLGSDDRLNMQVNPWTFTKDALNG